MIFEIISRSYRKLLEEKAALSRGLIFPFILLVIIGVIEDRDLAPIAENLVSFASVLINAVLAIVVHRVILIGSSSIPRWGLAVPTKRELVYVAHVIVLYLMSILPFLIFGFIPFVGVTFALLMVGWLAGRFLLVFPSIAIEKRISLAESWRVTSEYPWLVFLLLIIFPLVLSQPIALLYPLLFGSVIVNVLYSFLLIFTIANLSITFEELVLNDNGG